MLHILDVLAVREVVHGLPWRQRRICELLMHACNHREVAERMRMSRRLVTYHIDRIREAFVRAGFEPPRGRRRLRGWQGVPPRRWRRYPRQGSRRARSTGASREKTSRHKSFAHQE